MGENWLNFAIVLVIVPGAKCYPNSINPIDVQTKPKILVNTNLVIKCNFKGGLEFFSFFFLGRFHLGGGCALFKTGKNIFWINFKLPCVGES